MTKKLKANYKFTYQSILEIIVIPH